MKFLFKRLPNKVKGYSLLGLLVIGGSILLYLPADYFDTGQAMCVSVLLANVECYACGMTRAIQHLIHLEFEVAYQYNKLAFIAFPLATGLILWEAFRFLREEKPADKE